MTFTDEDVLRNTVASLEANEATLAVRVSREHYLWLASEIGQQIRPVPLPNLRMQLAMILEWYEQIPNDELPDEPVRKAFAAVNAALGIPEK